MQLFKFAAGSHEPCNSYVTALNTPCDGFLRKEIKKYAVVSFYKATLIKH